MSKNQIFLNALLRNNTDLIKIIYKTNFKKVQKFVIQNKGQTQDAEDIFQLALLQLAIRYKKEKFVIKTNFNAYLFTVCKNLWRRELNKQKNKVTNFKIYELKDESEDIAVSILEQKQWDLFNESFNLLSKNCQKVLKLFFNKTPYSKMIEILNYNTEIVARQRVFKCKKILKKIIINNKDFKSLKHL